MICSCCDRPAEWVRDDDRPFCEPCKAEIVAEDLPEADLCWYRYESDRPNR